MLRTEPAAAPGTVVMWSGSVSGFEQDGEAEPLTTDADPRNWSPSAWASLDQAIQRWVDASRSTDLIIRTHAMHIVSDAPSALRFARTWGEQGVRLAYDLASMFTPETARRGIGEDLLARRLDALSNPELARGIAFVLIANTVSVERLVDPAPIDQGLLDPDKVRAAAAICSDLGIPTAVLEADLESGL